MVEPLLVNGSSAFQIDGRRTPLEDGSTSVAEAGKEQVDDCRRAEASGSVSQDSAAESRIRTVGSPETQERSSGSGPEER